MVLGAAWRKTPAPASAQRAAEVAACAAAEGSDWGVERAERRDEGFGDFVAFGTCAVGGGGGGVDGEGGGGGRAGLLGYHCGFCAEVYVCMVDIRDG